MNNYQKALKFDYLSLTLNNFFLSYVLLMLAILLFSLSLTLIWIVYSIVWLVKSITSFSFNYWSSSGEDSSVDKYSVV